MRKIVYFKSEKFKPFLPNEVQVNPNVYGAELAFWLAEKLAEKGVVTSYPDYEDWGWYLNYTPTEEDEFLLCCSNEDGEANSWICFLQLEFGVLFWKRKSNMSKAKPLLDALKSILEESKEILDVEWEMK